MPDSASDLNADTISTTKILGGVERVHIGESVKTRILAPSVLLWAAVLLIGFTVPAHAQTPPTAADATVTTKEDEAYAFTVADFGFSDTDVGDTLSHVKIISLPGEGEGTLSLNGTAIDVGTPPQVTATELRADKLIYTPPANENGPAFTSFKFKVSDGSEDSASEYTMTMDVQPEVTGSPAVYYEENGTDSVATYTVNGSATWSLKETGDYGYLEIGSATGMLSFDADSFPNGPDFETPVDLGSNNTYAVRVLATVTDGGASVTGELAVIVTVTDMNEYTVSFGSAIYTAKENGTAATVAVTLSAATDRDLTIPLTANPESGDFTAPDAVVFQMGQQDATITVTATEDPDGNDETVTLGFGGLPTGVTAGSPDMTTVTLDDDDEPGVTVSLSSVTVREGGSANYTVKLDTEPTDSVTITVMRRETGIDTDLTADPDTLIFRDSNWNTSQTVTISAAEDDDGEAGVTVFIHAVTSSDTIYKGISAGSVTATEADNDKPGVTISPTSVTVPEGGSASYTVQLDTPPTFDVTVYVVLGPASDPDAKVTVSPDSLVFTDSDWNVPQTVTIFAAEDADSSDVRVTVRHGLAGNDEEYNDDNDEITVAEVTVTEADNDRNYAPAPVDDAAVADEDTDVVIRVLDNDTDANGDDLIVSAVGTPSRGTVAITDGGTTVTYSPYADYDGRDAFEYTVSDGWLTAMATVTVTMLPVPDPPVAVDDTAETDEDTSVEIAVLANDKDADGDRLRVKSVTSPGHGTATVNDDGTVTYTPDPNFDGTDVFRYTATDGTFNATARVTVTVRATNDGPEAADDTAETDEDTAIVIPVLANDKDADGDTLIVSAVGTPSHGTAAITDDGTTVTYTPTADYHGDDAFEYTISDGSVTAKATVTVTVRPVNDGPEATDDEAETDEDTSVEIHVLANDADRDGDRLSVRSVTDPGHGTVAITGDGTTVTYTPNANYHGGDAFEYTVSDGKVTATAAVTVTVHPVNDPPEAADDAAETDEDTAVEIDVLANDTDVDGDELSVQPATDPEHGTVTVNGDGTVTYTPDADYYGGDAFEYTISDGSATATAAVTLTVHPVNDAPVAEDDAAETTEDNAVTIPVLDNDSDAEGSTLSVESATQPGNGTASVNADGTVSYTPHENYHGADSFQYTVTDGEATATGTVSVTIHSVNDPPAATGQMPDMALIVGEGPGTLDAAGFFEDVDGDELAYGAVSSEAGVASVSASGSALTVTAVSEGAATITVTASDGQASATQTFSVAVRVDEQAEKQMVENVLAAMGRNMLTSVTTAIAGRFSGSGGGAGLTVAGRQMSLRDGSVLMALADLTGARRGPDRGRERMTGAELVRSSSFTLPLGQQSGGGRWALWGQGDLRSFEGTDYAGDLTTGYAGLDFRAGNRWVAGVSVSRGGGDMAYSVLGGRDRQMTTTLTGVYPYLRWQPGRATEIWTIAGMGRGDLENQRAGQLERSDLSMRMGVVGVRQSLSGSGALRFGLRGDAGYVRLSTAEGAELTDGLAADAMRIRLGFEGSYTAALGGSVALEPFAEAGAVRDGGDGDTGNGLEVAGGLRLGGSRVHVEARGRMMAIHTAEDYKEQGFSVAVAVNAGEGGSGLSMSLAPRWGARTESAGTLWRDEGLREVAEGRPGVGPGSLDAKIGYGLGVRDGESMLTPFGELNLSGSDNQRAQIGARLAMPESAGQMLSLELAAMRGRRANEAPKYGLELRGSLKLR